jgi:16S rRNA (guanine966-N2)-methyltransferase
MRVIAGELGGRVIASPSEKTTRPTTDRVRESMFSSLFSRLDTFEGLSVLDAFSGSGALGIEALSRGASRCLFFERDAVAHSVLSENLSSLQLRAPRVDVRGEDVFEAAARGALSQGHPFELVLLDPPYAFDAACVLELLDALGGNGDLQDGAVIAYEHALADKRHVTEVFEGSGRFTVTGQKKYGKIGVTYLAYSGR